MARNKVIAGDYKGCSISTLFGVIFLNTSFFDTIELNKDNIKEYEIIDEESKKSAVSAVGRAFVGGVILGPVGWLAGLSAKNKRTHTIAMEFKW